MLQPLLRKNDRLANILIISVSVIVFGVVVALGRLPKLNVDLGFSPHAFALANAVINSAVSVLLVAALWLVRRGRIAQHRNVMMVAMVLSVLFLVSYIAHHLLVDDTPYGGSGFMKYLYWSILITHIVLAAVILPFILYTAYRGLNGDYERHKEISRYTFPLWLYVSVTGVIVYLMISPYYQY